ncbi:MAG: hypothetical protein KC800_16185 [Candidatus Eremiobacteraeota bacterium]|nr:hypothetical protein [Candidatus Eremiobacteraeota bacterium]
MITVSHTPSALRPSYAHGIVAVFLLGFYLGLLFGVGAFAAWIMATRFFRGKFRLLVGFGGGFFGLATWFSVMLNHKDQYERVVAFLAQYLSQNWAVFLTDSFICSLGAMLFVGTLGATHRSTKKMVRMLGRKVKGSKDKPADSDS